MSLGDVNGRSYDVAVIGGGINGAGIACEAARRGYRTLLVEKEDFGWGTTWRSTKLIHGGLRYLEHGNVRLVFESLRERERLLREYPGLVKPLRFLLPLYRGSRRPAWQVRAGLLAYDLLSWNKSLAGHRRVSLADAFPGARGLRSDDLGSLYAFSDCQILYPERLALQQALAARDMGAAVLNHTAVTGVEQAGGALRVSLRGSVAGPDAEVRAASVVNASGPWLDAVLGLAGSEGKPLVGGTKGSHLVFDLEGEGPADAILSTARSDGRVFFIVPWRGYHIAGTTEVPHDGPPDGARIDDSEVEYLLQEAGFLLPHVDLTARVIYSYSGVRPLPWSPGTIEAAVTREHVISRSRELPGLVSVLGGKLSTFQPLAREVMDGLPHPPEQREVAPAPAAAPPGPWAARAAELGLERRQREHLAEVFGGAAAGILAEAAQRTDLLETLNADGGAIEAEVVWAVRQEEARTLSDVLMRRTGIAWERSRGLDCCARAAEIMEAELGWSRDETARQIDAFRRDVERDLPVPALPA